MCGIVGFIDPTRMSANTKTLEVLQDTIFHRGPDGAGQYIEGPLAMGMRRLSVIDIAGGDQPLFGNNGRVVAFQNGEIYNHRELRVELENAGYNFVSRSDTEVLVHGYVYWGIEELVRRLDGMYAIAILDRDTGILHLARDRFGEKPLFYTASSGYFAYSSSLLPLSALPWVEMSTNALALDRYLALHFSPGEDTIFTGIRRILPGHRMEVRIATGSFTITPYYKLKLREHSPQNADTRLPLLLEHAVESRLEADVPVGVFLSGGLDSSIVAAIAAQKKSKIATFSMGFSSGRYDESDFAETISRHVGSSHHRLLFDENSFVELLPKVADALDEPIGDQALLPLYWLSARAREYVTVVLSGEGADEVFAGYGYYRQFSIAPSIADRFKRWLGKAPKEAMQLDRLISNTVPVSPSGFPLLTDVSERKLLLGQELLYDASWEASFMSWLDEAYSRMQRANAADMATWLPDNLLVKFDRMTMAHSIEGRAPFLQSDIVEYGLSLRPRNKMNAHESKVMLRKAAHRWIPKEILERPKQGFVLPMKNWLKQWFVLQGDLRRYLQPVRDLGLDHEALYSLVDSDLRAGVNRERLLFAIVLLLEWHVSFQRRRAEISQKLARHLL